MSDSIYPELGHLSTVVKVRSNFGPRPSNDFVDIGVSDNPRPFYS